jgi:hypothetical protein
MPPTLVLLGIKTINVANVDLTMLGHGYIAEARDLLTDMHALITRGAPPDEVRTARGEKRGGSVVLAYWRVIPHRP